MLMKHFSFLLMNFYKYSLRISYVLVKKILPPEQRYLLRERRHELVVPGTMNCALGRLDKLLPIRKYHMSILHDR